MNVGGPRVDLLLKYGRAMAVDSVGGMTPQQCFTNAVEHAIVQDVDYVEGMTKVADVVWITHAWNHDRGGYTDFTLKDVTYPYFGVVIPRKIAYEVMRTRQWGAGDGVLGTLSMLPEKRRLRMVRAIERANKVA